MAELVLASDGAPAPADVLPALRGGRHAVRRCPLGLRALDLPGDVVLLDATTDPGAARRLAPLVSTRPVLLLVDDEAARQVDATWGVADIVHVRATAAELDLRLRLALAADAPLHADEVVIDEAGYRAHVAGSPLDLTYTEFELLRFLVANPGRVHSREHLLAEVWGQDYFGGTRTVDVHVRRLRAKLGPEHDALIETVRNVGYRFSPR